MRYTKHLTVKEWKRFDWDKQELLCKRYKIILTDWQPKWKKRYDTLKKYVNQKNFDKGLDIFNKGVQDFSKQMDDMTKGLGGDPKNNKKNLDSIWGNKKKGGGNNNSIPLWGSKPTATKKRRKKKVIKSDSNMDIIWGKKK
jgi:hypothetical protein